MDFHTVFRQTGVGSLASVCEDKNFASSQIHPPSLVSVLLLFLLFVLRLYKMADCQG